jgi:rhamnulokinase
MKDKKFLAFDIGAESGRALLGNLKDNKIELKEIHRFPNGMMNVLGHYHWNIYRLYEEIQKSLEICAIEEKVMPEAIGIDTWGVDYALLAKDGSILEVPFAYRDPRTNSAIEEFFTIVPRKKIYELTGNQFLQFNTLFQLYAAKRDKSPILEMATDLLFMPDVLNYMITGIKKSEFTYATTSQLYNPMKNDWEDELFKALDISRSIMQEIVSPGTILGDLHEAICRQVGIDPLPVIAVAAHDTGSAIAAIPAAGTNWAYISSGTWSLMGIESAKPLISPKTLEYNLTNEGGVGYTFRVLKNIMGLWLLQQCRKSWSDQNYDYGTLVELAKTASPFKAFLDPEAPDFLNPDDMPTAIAGYCRRTGQYEPASHAEVVRMILESLALKYRFTLDQLKDVSPFNIEKIYIIGGGVQNKTLCQFTANATGLPVIAALVEGTAVGNIMVQAMALGYVNSLREIRKVIGNSFEPTVYEPQQVQQWENAYDNFLTIIKQ